MGWITNLEKGDFIGRDVLLKVKQDGLKRKLVGFEVEEERAFPRHGYPIFSGGIEVGHVTSGTLSPILGKGIGLGYVPVGLSQPGSSIQIKIREKLVEARVTKLPFIRK